MPPNSDTRTDESDRMPEPTSPVMRANRRGRPSAAIPIALIAVAVVAAIAAVILLTGAPEAAPAMPPL